jgi:hypothetical protein
MMQMHYFAQMNSLLLWGGVNGYSRSLWCTALSLAFPSVYAVFREGLPLQKSALTSLTSRHYVSILYSLPEGRVPT